MTAIYTRGLRCRECRAEVPHGPVHVCELCFGPLEVDYDYDALAAAGLREAFAARPPTMWRYAELLPLTGEPVVGRQVGGTPLLPAPRLGAALGVERVWVKNDAVCHPTLSFKDRVVSLAVSVAVGFGFDHIACASTGNLANAVAAAAAALGLKATILVPRTLEGAKILATRIYGARVIAIDGTYDDVNRLCAEAADRYRWAFVNVNLRPYYAEGSKTYALEIADQLGWTLPDHVVAPMAGGSLVAKIAKAWAELATLGLIEPRARPTRIHGAQPAGCAPSPTRSSPGASSSCRSRSRAPSRARSRSATRPTASTPPAPSGRAADRPRRSATRRSLPRCASWPRPRASSPRPPGA